MRAITSLMTVRNLMRAITSLMTVHNLFKHSKLHHFPNNN